MRKLRKVETSCERDERLNREAHGKAEDAAATDAAVHAMIKASIKSYGP